MLERLNTLDIQEQKAETEVELADLTRKSNQYFLEISNINDGIANKKMGAGNLYSLENWRNDQAEKIVTIKGKLKALQKEIQLSKQKYKKVLTQNLAAKESASLQEHIQTRHSDERETSHAIDMFLLSKIP